MPEALTLDNYLAEAKALEEKYKTADAKDIAVLEQCARDFRNLATRYVHAGVLAGFTLDVNGVDASLHVLSWPEHALERDEISVHLLHSAVAQVPMLPGMRTAADTPIPPKVLPAVDPKVLKSSPLGALKIPE